MTTPEEAVQEARVAMFATLLRCHACCEYAVPCSPAHTAPVDALLAAERARLAARVEGMMDNHNTSPDSFFDRGARHALSDVLALLREPA